MIKICDPVFRAYKKKSGYISLHLRGFLLITTSTGFNLSRYLKDFNLWIEIPKYKEIEFDEVGFFEESECKFDGNHMLHVITASTILPLKTIETCVTRIKFMYHLSFTGHPVEEPKFVESYAVIKKNFRGK